MCHRSAVRIVHHWFNPHRQLIYRPAHRLTEVVQSLAIYLSIEGPTNIDIILFIDQFLVYCEPEARCRIE